MVAQVVKKLSAEGGAGGLPVRRRPSPHPKGETGEGGQGRPSSSGPLAPDRQWAGLSKEPALEVEAHDVDELEVEAASEDGGALDAEQGVDFLLDEGKESGPG